MSYIYVYVILSTIEGILVVVRHLYFMRMRITPSKAHA